MSPRRRRRKSNDELLVAFGALVLVGLVLDKVGQWVWGHWWVLVVLGLLALGVLVGWVYRQVGRMRSAQLRVEGLTYSLSQLDAMHHSAFEVAVRDLLARDGSRDALRCGGRGDLGADVKGHDPAGRYWVIQCKHRRDGLRGSAIGTPELQTLNGTGRPVHGGDVVVMVTNAEDLRARSGLRPAAAATPGRPACAGTVGTRQTTAVGDPPCGATAPEASPASLSPYRIGQGRAGLPGRVGAVPS